MNLKRIFIPVFNFDLRSLAVMRILISFILLWDIVATRSRFLTLFYTDEGALPRKVLLAAFANNPPFSLHMAIGSTVGEGLLLLLAAFFALNVLIGYRTRLFTILSWLMLISLDNRDPFSMSEDFYLLIILFWAMFLPWGRKLSIDSFIKKDAREASNSVCSWASTAYILQIISFYISVGVMKHLSVIWNNGQALYLAVSSMGMDTSLAKGLLFYPDILSLMTKGIIYMEIILPLFFLVPFFNYALRTAALSVFILFHIMIWLTLAVGYLSPISIAALIGLMPSVVWDKYPKVVVAIDGLMNCLQQRLHLTASVIELHPTITRVVRKTVTVFIVLFALGNLSTAFSNIGLKMPVPLQAHFLFRSIYLDHHWNMFSRLSAYSPWCLFEGKLSSGMKVNILDGSLAMYNAPTATNNFFKEVEVQKFLATANPRLYGPYWGNYLCREWNNNHTQENSKLKQIRLIETMVPVKLYNKRSEIKRVIFGYQCR